MKRSLLLLLILIVILPLFGKVTISESVPEDYRNTIEDALIENTNGRRDVDVLFDSFSLEDDLKFLIALVEFLLVLETLSFKPE